MTLIGLDSQAGIRPLNNQKFKPSHYLLNHILTAAESLHVKQDKSINAADFRKAKCQGIQLTVKTRDVIDLKSTGSLATKTSSQMKRLMN